MQSARSIGVLLALSVFAMLLTAECAKAEIGEISGGIKNGDMADWYYEGDVENTKVRGQFCNRTICAHGKGRVSTDGSVDYTGTFAHGDMEGYGTYETDFYTYVGGLKSGRFDGSGTLTCDGFGKVRRYEGVFVDGRMKGSFKVTPPGRIQMYSGETVGYAWPCK